MRRLVRLPIIVIITPVLAILAIKSAPLIGSALVAIWQALQSLF